MKNHRFDRYLYMGITAVLVLAAATAVIFLFLERKAILALGGRIISILTPIIYGAVLAFLFSPVYNGGVRFTGELLGKKMKNEKLKAFLQKTVGTVLSLTLLYIIVVSLAMMIIPQLYSSIAGIVNTMPVYIQNLYEWLTGLFANNPPLEELPFSLAQSNDALIHNIETFDEAEYDKKCAAYVQRIQFFDDGHASEAAVDAMLAQLSPARDNR